MIKRNGVTIKDNRFGRKTADQNIKIMLDGYYAVNGSNVLIEKQLQYSVDNTVLYDEELTIQSYDVMNGSEITVTNETTTQAAVRLLSEGYKDLVALNFASAKNPGGGFLAGANAQEEDLCRMSCLYRCLTSQPKYYNDNIMQNDNLYTDNIIYSPNVPFIRDEELNLLDQPYSLSIITSPAPNLSNGQSISDDKLRSILKNRIKKILLVAAQHHHKNLILGAWGCGIFSNDPNVVSSLFMECLSDISLFKTVCFAVYDTRPNTPLFKTFSANVFRRAGS